MYYLCIMKLSIVVAVYNAETWLDRCVQSLLNQELSLIEIILVDDGSTDGSSAMCDRWAEKNSLISVFHKVNGGLSDARNAGIERASGEYITFVDSDDYVERKTFSSLINYLDQHDDVDIVEYPILEHAGSSRENLLTFPIKTYTLAEQYWCDAKTYSHSYACNKIFRRELFVNVKFPCGLVFEDVYTIPELLKISKKIATFNQGLYVYCQNDAGITSTAGADQLRLLLLAHLKHWEWLCKSTLISDKSRSLYYMHILNIQLTLSMLSREKPLLPYYPAVLSSEMTPVMILKLLTVRIIKVNNLCKLFRKIKKIQRFAH